jgi:Ca2+-binding EF-hand superfamily protein
MQVQSSHSNLTVKKPAPRTATEQGFDALVTGALVSGAADKQTLGMEYRDALFAIADSNKDGQLTRDELSEQIHSGDGNGRQTTALWQSLDKDGANSISHDEFKGQLATSVSSAKGSLGSVGFGMFDANGDGKLTKAEIEQLLEKGQHGQQAAARVLAELTSYAPSGNSTDV